MSMSYNPSDRHFNEILHVTNAETDQWFIPGNNQAESGTAANRKGDNPDNGTMAERVDNCEALTGIKQKANPGDPDVQMGKAVQPNTLADWW